VKREEFIILKDLLARYCALCDFAKNTVSHGDRISRIGGFSQPSFRLGFVLRYHGLKSASLPAIRKQALHHLITR
jgi:hypothetical protein